MSTDTLRDEVIQIICEQLDFKANAGDVSEDKTFQEDLGADSLAVVELVLALEEKFNVRIPDDEVEKIKTVGDAIAYIRDHS